MSTDVVTSGLLRPTNVDEVAYAKFVAKTVASIKRMRDKAASKPRAIYHGATDAECVTAAEVYCRAYRHQFRVLVPVTNDTPR